MHSAGLVGCGLTHRVVTLWIFAESLRFLAARQSIPAGREHNDAQLVKRRELGARLRMDREICWSQRALEMGHAAQAVSPHVSYQ